MGVNERQHANRSTSVCVVPDAGRCSSVRYAWHEEKEIQAIQVGDSPHPLRRLQGARPRPPFTSGDPSPADKPAGKISSRGKAPKGKVNEADGEEVITHVCDPKHKSGRWTTSVDIMDGAALARQTTA